jgi:hypothetical protein
MKHNLLETVMNDISVFTCACSVLFSMLHAACLFIPRTSSISSILHKSRQLSNLPEVTRLIRREPYLKSRLSNSRTWVLRLPGCIFMDVEWYCFLRKLKSFTNTISSFLRTIFPGMGGECHVYLAPGITRDQQWHASPYSCSQLKRTMNFSSAHGRYSVS